MLLCFCRSKMLPPHAEESLRHPYRVHFRKGHWVFHVISCRGCGIPSPQSHREPAFRLSPFWSQFCGWQGRAGGSVCWEGRSPNHQMILRHVSAQVRHCLPRDSIRPHRLRAQSHRPVPTLDAISKARPSPVLPVHFEIRDSHDPLLGFS